MPPSVRVYVRPDVARGLDAETSSRLLRELWNKVAVGLHLPPRVVEACMMRVDHCVDHPPLEIEIMYSVTRDLQPDEDARRELATNIATMIKDFDWLPMAVNGVVVWVLPQHDAISVIEKWKPKM